MFFGELSPQRALVYARVPRPAEAGDWLLAGQVRGPRCLHAQTLPLRAALVDQGPGPTLLARAVVPDPCCWSPDLPAIYDVTVELRRGEHVVWQERREIGLRWLGTSGRRLKLEARPWVLRGVRTTSAVETLPRHWHAARAGFIAPAAADEALAEASQWGALAVVEVAGDTDRLAAALGRLARFPAVAIALIDGPPGAGVHPPVTAPNLLLAQRIRNASDPVAPWARLLWVDARQEELLAGLAASSQLPIVAERALSERLPLEQARAACDALQRDLAPIGQFAAYVV